MNNIKLYDPFSAEPFENVFRGFLQPIRFNIDTNEPQIKIDVEESDDAYTIRAEIPGAKKDDIDIEINGGVVSISAEVKNERDVKDNGKVLRSERYYGRALRQLSLAQEIDEAKADAKYENGVLQLKLPKRANARAKRLTVN
ncbi:MAG: Hsp20/alpha crystallin family protein [Rhodocyclaceae bacterium]|nr:Hsp20/alpha crystallin family protein [Rhodocyclaceae bacterium]